MAAKWIELSRRRNSKLPVKNSDTLKKIYKTLYKVLKIIYSK